MTYCTVLLYHSVMGLLLFVVVFVAGTQFRVVQGS